MSQLHCYLPDELAKQFQRKAKQAHLSVSKYLALLVKKELENQWPQDYFELFGGWQGPPLERPKQDSFEQREQFK
ncbi:MAG: hypothetical protein Q9N68_13570 [Gammaproteobacteria bacterium]|nr:hypothetical protein [Gammaproteobacteria bacterium]